MTSAYWKDRRVMVTGHTGFMGGWLCSLLIRAGAQVTGYALAPQEPHSFCLATGIEGRIAKSTIADIRDRTTLETAVKAAAPEVLFHLAAQPLVHDAFHNPVDTFETNVMGTVNILEAARAVSDLRSLIMVTTDKVYLNRNWHWPYRETDRLGGREPYSASKAASEIVIDAYRASYLSDKGIVAIRAGNIIGGGDWAANRLVPDAIESFRKSEPLVLRHPGSTRPWQHVLDPLAGYLILAEHLADRPNDYSGGWNFGPAAEDCRPVGELAQSLAAAWGPDAKVQSTGRSEIFEETLLSLDSAQAHARLGWHPRWRLEDGVRALADWYRAYYDDADMWAVTQDQIAQFEKQDPSHGP